jgi:hypothetical protein
MTGKVSHPIRSNPAVQYWVRKYIDDHPTSCPSTILSQEIERLFGYKLSADSISKAILQIGIDRQPVVSSSARSPEIVARVKKFVLGEDWPPGQPGNAVIAEMISKEFGLDLRPGQISGMITREKIERGRMIRAKARDDLVRANRKPKKEAVVKDTTPKSVSTTFGSVFHLRTVTLKVGVPIPHVRGKCQWPLSCDIPTLGKYCPDHSVLAGGRKHATVASMQREHDPV